MNFSVKRINVSSSNQLVNSLAKDLYNNGLELIYNSKTDATSGNYDYENNIQRFVFRSTGIDPLIEEQTWVISFSDEEFTEELPGNSPLWTDSASLSAWEPNITSGSFIITSENAWDYSTNEFKKGYMNLDTTNITRPYIPGEIKGIIDKKLLRVNSPLTYYLTLDDNGFSFSLVNDFETNGFFWIVTQRLTKINDGTVRQTSEFNEENYLQCMFYKESNVWNIYNWWDEPENEDEPDGYQNRHHELFTYIDFQNSSPKLFAVRGKYTTVPMRSYEDGDYIDADKYDDFINKPVNTKKLLTKKDISYNPTEVKSYLMFPQDINTVKYPYYDERMSLIAFGNAGDLPKDIIYSVVVNGRNEKYIGLKNIFNNTFVEGVRVMMKWYSNEDFEYTTTEEFEI